MLSQEESCFMCGKKEEKGKLYPKGELLCCFECRENEDLIMWEMAKEAEYADFMNNELERNWNVRNKRLLG